MRAGQRVTSLANMWPFVLIASGIVHSGHARPLPGVVSGALHEHIISLGRGLLEAGDVAVPDLPVTTTAPVDPVPEATPAVDTPVDPVPEATPDLPAGDVPPVEEDSTETTTVDDTPPAVDEDLPAATDTPTEEDVATTPSVTDAPATEPSAAVPAPTPRRAPAEVPEPEPVAPAPAPEPEIPPPPPPPPPPAFAFGPAIAGGGGAAPPGTSFAGDFPDELAPLDAPPTTDTGDDPAAGQNVGQNAGQQVAPGSESGDDGDEDNTARNVGIGAAAVVGLLALLYIAWKLFGVKKAHAPRDSEVDAQFNALAASTGNIGGGQRSFHTNRSSTRFTPPAAPIAESVWTQM